MHTKQLKDIPNKKMKEIPQALLSSVSGAGHLKKILKKTHCPTC